MPTRSQQICVKKMIHTGLIRQGDLDKLLMRTRIREYILIWKWWLLLQLIYLLF